MHILQEEHFPEVLYKIWQTLLIWSNLFQEYFCSSQGNALTFKSRMVLFWREKNQVPEDLKNYYKAILVFHKKLLIHIWCNASLKWFISYTLLPFIGYILNISNVYWIYFYMSSEVAASKQILVLLRHGFSCVLGKIAEGFGLWLTLLSKIHYMSFCSESS